jgi:uncharacterized protein YjiS (DUF1127 family)
VAGLPPEDRVMFLTSLLAWISRRIAARRDMRSLKALSDKALADIGLTRGMIEGAGSRHWNV